MSSLDDFISNIKNVNGPRYHEVKGSLGVYDSYKYIRKNKWFNIGRPLTEKEFYSIIRTINNYLSDELSKGNDINLPMKMGKLELRKRKARISIVDGKIKTNLPIDWSATFKLWYEDEEAFKNRTLIKMEEKEIFNIRYNKEKANYKNKAFYQFIPNREIKIQLKHNIKEGRIDAFNLSWQNTQDI